MHTSPFLLSADLLRRYERLALWSEIWGPGGLELAASLAGALNLPSGARVLDAGGGSGEIACFLAMQFGWNVTLIDSDDLAVRIARQKSKTRGVVGQVSARRGDLRAPEVEDASFEGVFCQGSLDMLEERRSEAVTALARALVPGGTFGIAEPVLRRSLTPQERRDLHGSDFARPYLTLEQHGALLEAVGLRVETAFLHPDAVRLWNEFIGPWLDEKGRLKRPGLESVVEAWRRDGGDVLSLGVIVAHKP